MLQHLAGQVDGCEEDILGVVIQCGVGKVEAFQEQHRRSLDLVGEAECAAHILHLAGIVLEQRSLLRQAGRPGLLGCGNREHCQSWSGRKQLHAVRRAG